MKRTKRDAAFEGQGGRQDRQCPFTVCDAFDGDRFKGCSPVTKNGDYEPTCDVSDFRSFTVGSLVLSGSLSDLRSNASACAACVLD